MTKTRFTQNRTQNRHANDDSQSQDGLAQRVDDLLGLVSSFLGEGDGLLAGLKSKAQMAREVVAKKLDLVTREEMEIQLEAVKSRLARLEAGSKPQTVGGKRTESTRGSRVKPTKVNRRQKN